jgi:hypothetical protein
MTEIKVAKPLIIGSNMPLTKTKVSKPKIIGITMPHVKEIMTARPQIIGTMTPTTHMKEIMAARPQIIGTTMPITHVKEILVVRPQIIGRKTSTTQMSKTKAVKPQFIGMKMFKRPVEMLMGRTTTRSGRNMRSMRRIGGPNRPSSGRPQQGPPPRQPQHPAESPREAPPWDPPPSERTGHRKILSEGPVQQKDSQPPKPESLRPTLSRQSCIYLYIFVYIFLVDPFMEFDFFR